MPKFMPLSQTNVDAYIYNTPIRIRLSTYHSIVYVGGYKSVNSTQGRLQVRLILL
jgi:hypothetical protein